MLVQYIVLPSPCHRNNNTKTKAMQEKNFKVQINLSADVQDFKIEANFSDCSYYDMPKIFEAENVLQSFTDMIKRVKSYKRIVITVSAFITDANHNFCEEIKSVRYVHDYIDCSFERLERAECYANMYQNWLPAQMSDIKADIKEIVKAANYSQIKSLKKVA